MATDNGSSAVPTGQNRLENNLELNNAVQPLAAKYSVSHGCNPAQATWRITDTDHSGKIDG